jgi:hypothetical protein
MGVLSVFWKWCEWLSKKAPLVFSLIDERSLGNARPIFNDSNWVVELALHFMQDGSNEVWGFAMVHQ